jgi:hypothetical protein
VEPLFNPLAVALAAADEPEPMAKSLVADAPFIVVCGNTVLVTATVCVNLATVALAAETGNYYILRSV